MADEEEDVDQDALAAEWGADFSEDDDVEATDDDVASKWASMVDEDEPDSDDSGTTERVLNLDLIHI